MVASMLELREEVNKVLPISSSGIVIDIISIVDFVKMKSVMDYEEKARVTSRPIVNRSDEEQIKYYISLLDKAAFIPLGVFKDNSLVGNVMCFDYNPRNKSIEVGYFIRKEDRGKGYGKLALQVFCQILLREVGMSKLIAQTAEFNKSSINILESTGFHLDGVLREHHEYKGKLYCDHLYSLLSAEYVIRS